MFFFFKYCNTKLDTKSGATDFRILLRSQNCNSLADYFFGAGRTCLFYQKEPSWTSLAVILIICVHPFFVCQNCITAPVLNLQPPRLGYFSVGGAGELQCTRAAPPEPLWAVHCSNCLIHLCALCLFLSPAASGGSAVCCQLGSSALSITDVELLVIPHPC